MFYSCPLAMIPPPLSSPTMSLLSPDSDRRSPANQDTHDLLHFAEVVQDFGRREHTKLLLIIDHPDLNVVF